MKRRKGTPRAPKVIPLRKVVFRPRGNYRISQKDAVVIGTRLLELSGDPTLRSVSVRQVLDDAKREESPLHRFYDWDVARAAERHWLNRTRYLCRAVAVEIKVTGGGVVSRGWHAVHVVIGHDPETGTPIEERRYVPVDVVRKKSELMHEVLADALRELEGWSERYSEYAGLAPLYKEVHRELGPVFAGIGAVRARLDALQGRKAG